MVVKIKSRRAIACSVTVSAYARIHGVRTYRSCLLPFPFLQNACISPIFNSSASAARRQPLRCPQAAKPHAHESTRCRLRWRGTRGAMTATSRSALDVVWSEGNGGEGDDEGRCDGRTGSEPRGTFFAGKRSGDRDGHGRQSKRDRLPPSSRSSRVEAVGVTRRLPCALCPARSGGRARGRQVRLGSIERGRRWHVAGWMTWAVASSAR